MRTHLLDSHYPGDEELAEIRDVLTDL